MLSSLAIANGAPTLYHLRFVLLNGFVGTWVPRFWETSTFHGPWPCCSYNVTMRHEVAKDSSTQVLGRFRSIKYILKIHHSMCMYCIYNIQYIYILWLKWHVFRYILFFNETRWNLCCHVFSGWHGPFKLATVLRRLCGRWDHETNWIKPVHHGIICVFAVYFKAFYGYHAKDKWSI